MKSCDGPAPPRRSGGVSKHRKGCCGPAKRLKGVCGDGVGGCGSSSDAILSACCSIGSARCSYLKQFIGLVRFLEPLTMPPKRSREVSLALSADPLKGWIQTPVAKDLALCNSLSGVYLSAYLHGHEMPVTKERVEGMNGRRLWNAKKSLILAGSCDGNKLYASGVEALVKAFNHGFAAPLEAQEKLLTFVASLPGEDYQAVARSLQEHYTLCRRYRSSSLELSDPPSYLDLFKNDRVAKVWSSEEGVERVLISANDVLLAWPELMHEGWDSGNASRDASSIWDSCRPEIAVLHSDLLSEGQTRDLQKYTATHRFFYGRSISFKFEGQGPRIEIATERNRTWHFYGLAPSRRTGPTHRNGSAKKINCMLKI
jgi:hypothetical protein